MKNADQKKILSKYANDVTSRGLSVPAVFFLEMFKYLSFIMSQSMIVFGPIVTIFVNLIADVSYAFMSSYFFQTSSIKTKKLINTISGICLVLIGIYLFFSRFL